jgi:hypothetical protein
VPGEDRTDNSLDGELLCRIGISIGGMYHNDRNCNAGFTLDESIEKGLIYEDGGTVKALRSGNYTLSSCDHVLIPAGMLTTELNGEASGKTHCS